MRVVRSSEVAPQPVKEPGARDATVRWLISRPEGAPNFAMRLFELAPNGSTPLHQHDWEHEVYLLEGRAELVSESGPAEVEAGDAILILPREQHQLRNTGDAAARFLCLIPLPEED